MKVKLKVDKIEADRVILLSDGNGEISWPKNKLPENIHQGMSLEFFISENGQSDDDRKLAKEILNEILKTDT